MKGLKKIGQHLPNMPSMPDSGIMRYVLIVALAVLLGFAVMYIINIQKAAKETFEEAGGAGGSKYKVVYIYSTSCGYCTQFTPTFNAFAQTMQGSKAVQVLSYEKSMPEASPYLGYVSAFPTVLIMNGSSLVNSQTGNVSLAALKSFVTTASASASA